MRNNWVEQCSYISPLLAFTQKHTAFTHYNNTYIIHSIFTGKSHRATSRQFVNSNEIQLDISTGHSLSLLTFCFLKKVYTKVLSYLQLFAHLCCKHRFLQYIANPTSIVIHLVFYPLRPFKNSQPVKMFTVLSPC